MTFTPETAAAYERDGFSIARGLFSPEEVADYLAHFMGMHAENTPYAEGGVDMASDDPLRRYPRLMQMHRGDSKSFDYMIDARLRLWLKGLLGEEPYGVQTMMYFKPAGARGQALHQDQRYLMVKPGTCMAAWLALDDTDEENGCLQVVPGSHKLDLLCPVQSDTSTSFTPETVAVPPGMDVVSVPMKAGDVLFFNGQVIHGSGPNVSSDRFRRILVAHYVVAEAQAVAQWYKPVYRLDGTEIELETNPWGGPCGRYVDMDGVPTRIEEQLSDAIAAIH